MPISKNLKKIAKVLEIAKELEPEDLDYIMATWRAERNCPDTDVPPSDGAR